MQRTGLPLAVFQTVTVVYAVEVAPTCLRDFLTSFDLQMWVSCSPRGSQTA